MNESNYKDVSCIELAMALGLQKSENGNFHCFRPQLHKNNDRHASLLINHNGFHCFACGVSGNNVELVKLILNLDTAEAINLIEEIANIKPKQSNQLQANNSATKGKVHCRMISHKEPRFIWLEESKLELRNPELNDITSIYQNLQKIWTLKALTQLDIKINTNPYSLALPFDSQLFCYNPKQSQSYLVCEGRTDLITLVSIEAYQSFGIISRYNKTQKIKLKDGNSYYFLLDSDETPSQLASLIEEVPPQAQLFAVKIPPEYKDISDWHYIEPTDFFITLLNYLQNNYKEGSLNYEISKLDINLTNENKYQSALQKISNSIENRPHPTHQAKIYTADELLKKELPQIQYIIDNMLIEIGYGIISGRPKCGKSWLMLNLCIALASGGKFLGLYECKQKNVLYLALEDNENRMQSRLKTIFDNEIYDKNIPLDKLFILHKIKRFNDGGKEELRQYIQQNDIKVVVIDTQKRFTKIGHNSYDNDFEYKIGQEMQSFAYENGILLLSVLHNRKTKGNSNFAIDEIAGTYGISAGADFWAVLQKGKHGSNISFGGRDIKDNELLLSFDDQRGIWNAFGQEDTVNESDVNIKWEKIIINNEMTMKEVKDIIENTYQVHYTTAYKWINEAIKNKILYRSGKYLCIS